MQSFPTMAQIFDNKDFVATSIFCMAAIAGQLLHGVKQSLDGNVGCITWFTTSWSRTLSAVIGNLGGMVVFAATGVLAPILAQPNGFWALVLFGFSNGFSADSALNKASRAEWSAEERAAAKKDEPKP